MAARTKTVSKPGGQISEQRYIIIEKGNRIYRRLRTWKYEISSNLEYNFTCNLSKYKAATDRYELPLDTHKLTGISAGDGISQSRVIL